MVSNSLDLLLVVVGLVVAVVVCELPPHDGLLDEGGHARPGGPVLLHVEGGPLGGDLAEVHPRGDVGEGLEESNLIDD